MRGPTWGDRWRYRFDNWMSRGTGAVLVLLAAATISFVGLFGAISWLVIKFLAPADGMEPGEAPWDYLWDVLMGTLFPGGTGSETGWSFRLLMLVIAVGGLLFGASLIGVVTSGFQHRIAELRKGRSRVLESGHTVILGWGPKVFTIVGELAVANQSRRRAAIVLLADKDKVEMEDELRDRFGRRHGTRLICRSGDIRRRDDLELVGVDKARSVILLGESGDDHDNESIKSAFALTHRPDVEGAARLHVVAELAASQKLGVAQVAGGPSVQWVLGPDLIGRILVQTCRQAGLSAVYQDLLDFEGDEIYFTHQPGLAGQTFAEVHRALPHCSAIGLMRSGTPLLNPRADVVLDRDDAIIVIAEDDSLIATSEPMPVELSAIREPAVAAPRPERTLILGGCERLEVMLRELDDLVSAGSQVHVVSAGELPAVPHLTRMELTVERGDPTSPAMINALDLARFDHVIVMPELDTYSAARAESRTLVTLLLLHDAMARLGIDVNVVAEMLDDANRELAEAAGVRDFIVSDRLVALALAQLSENPGLAAVLADLFDADGVEIYLRPAGDYVEIGEEVAFAVIVEAALRRGETAIGYRIGAEVHDPSTKRGLRLNPAKADRKTFSQGDSVVVIAESH